MRGDIFSLEHDSLKSLEEMVNQRVSNGGKFWVRNTNFRAIIVQVIADPREIDESSQRN